MNTSERTRLAPPGGPLLDTEAAAGYLNVNPRWLERAVAEHRVEVVRIGRKLLVPTLLVLVGRRSSWPSRLLSGPSAGPVTSVANRQTRERQEGGPLETPPRRGRI